MIDTINVVIENNVATAIPRNQQSKEDEWIQQWGEELKNIIGLGVSLLIIDMTDIEWSKSVLIKTLIDAQQYANLHSVKVVQVNVHPQIYDMYEFTDSITYFTIEEDVNTALETHNV